MSQFDLKITVTNLDHEILSNASVIVEHLEREQTIHAQYDVEKNCFVAPGAEPGTILFTIELDGYESQQRKVVIWDGKLAQAFCLGKQGARYLLADSKRIPLPDNKGLIAAIGSREIKQEQLKQNILKSIDSKNISSESLSLWSGPMGSILIQSEQELNEKQFGQLLETIRESSEVQKAGPLMDQRTHGLRVLIPAVSAEFENGTPEKSISRIADQIGATNIIPSSTEAQRYTFEFPNSYGFEVLDKAVELEAFEEVLTVSNVLSGTRERATAIDPNVFHWGSQWDKHTMKVGEAWEYIDMNVNSEIKFGDPRALVVVLDSGTETAAGDATNPDINGYTIDDVQTAIANGPISPPTATLTVLDTTGFSGSDVIRVGEETVTVSSVSNATELIVSALYHDHKKDTEVVHTTSPAVITYLDADANANTSLIITDPLSSAEEFKVGHQISIEASTSANWETVEILSISPNGIELTTTPVTKTHTDGTIVVQGRKMHRAVDFDPFALDNDNPEGSHGTAVATIIGARAENELGMAGTAPNTRMIHGLRYGGGSSPAVNDVLNQFTWLTGVKPYDAFGDQMDVLQQDVWALNSSIGWGENSISLNDDIRANFDLIIRRARGRRGIPLFLAVGNEESSIRGGLWVAYEKIIGVAASHKRVLSNLTSYVERRSSYSNFSEIDISADERIDFCAPSNLSSNLVGKHPPLYLGLIAGDVLGKGNLIDESDSSATVGTPFMVSRTSFRVAAAAGAATLQVDNSTLATDFAAGDWILLGDVYSTEWVEILSIDFSNPADKKINLDGVTTEAFGIGDLISKVPAYTSIKRSILPGSSQLYVSDVKGFKANDIILIGQHDESMKWVEIDSITTASNRINLKASSVSATPTQIIGFDDDETVKSVDTYSSGSFIEVNVDFPNRDKYFKQHSVIEAPQGSGKWYRITNITSGQTVSSYTSTKLSLSPSITTTVNPGDDVFIPKADYNPYVQGSSEITVDSSANFNADTWVLIGTPGSPGTPSAPAIESSYIHSTPTGTTVRLSGPYYAHPSGTKIHEGAAVNFQDRFGGTSGASPQAAGAAALIMSVNPDLTWIEVREILRRTADKINTGNTGFTAAQATANPDHTQGLGRWRNKADQYILDMTGASTGVSDTTPYYSDWYGYGRINVYSAVQSAKSHLTNGPDLMIRNYMIVNLDGSTQEDDGVTPTDLNTYTIDSPDIWVRDQYADQGDADSSAVGKSELPPHQNVTIGGDRSIYVRVINRASGLSGVSYQAWARIYLYLTNGSPDLALPGKFEDNVDIAGYSSGDSGIYYLGKGTHPVTDPGGELKLYDRASGYVGNTTTLDNYGGIWPGEQYKVVTRWDSAITPPLGTHKRTYVVAEVMPHDGPLAEPYFDRNNNISYKRVVFTEANIYEDATGSPALPKFIEHEGTDIVKNFKIDLRDWEYIKHEHIRIRFERITKVGGTEEVNLTFDGTNWVTDATITGYSISTTPTITTTGGAPDQYEFTGSITYREIDQTVILEAIVMEPDVAEQDHTNPTKPLVVRHKETVETQVLSAPSLVPEAGSGLAPATKPRIHVFADMDKIKTQDDTADVDNAFRPDSTDSETKHHITTVFSGDTPGDTINAYAVMTGRVFVQQDSTDSSKVNLFLKPITQSGLGFTPVKYYVYRGLNVADFLVGPTNPDNTQIALEAGSTPFIQSIYTNQANRNADNPTGTDTLTPAAFGWEPSIQTDLERPIDDYFYQANGQNEFQIAEQGMILGTFKNASGSDTFGFEIVLDDGSFIPTLEYARMTRFTLEIPSGATDLETHEKREEVLTFVDPAAFYSMHELAGVKSPAGLIDPADVFNDIVDKFINKNYLYLDIRSENNYSYNYYRNYSIPQVDTGGIISISGGADKDDDSFHMARREIGNFGDYSLDNYYWPYFIIPNGKIEVGDYGVFYILLRIADNPDPIVYVWNGFGATPRSNERFISGRTLIEDGQPVTKEIGFMASKIDLTTPNAYAKFKFKASVIKLTYSRKIPSGVDAENIVLPTEDFHDNVFGPLETVLQARSIDSVDTGSNIFKLEGNYENSINSGDIIEVTDATDTANNQIYTVTTATFSSGKTEITVAPPFSGSTAPLGKLTFGHHLWNVSLPTKWYSGPNRTFVDTTSVPADGTNPIFGFSYMANTGIAVDNGRMIFYATPRHFLDRAEEGRTVNQINLPGGVGAGDSFWLEVMKNNASLGISATNLKFSGPTYIPVLEFEQTDLEGGNPLKENFLALCFTEAEFNQIKRAVFEANFNTEHQLYLTLNNPTTLSDLNGVEYQTHEIWIRGWEDNSSTSNELGASYHEVSSSNTIESNPVKVYSLLENGLIFTSEDFANLEPIPDPKSPSDEAMRLESGALSALGSDPTMQGLVDTFQTSLSALVDDTPAMESLVNNAGTNIFDQAVANSSVFDARPLYWAQMSIRSALRTHNWPKKQKRTTRRMIESFEQNSRGMNSIDYSSFGSAKKILVVGFDPTSLDSKIGGNVETNSISGSLALSLHDQTYDDSGITGAIQSVIFPIRYNDYKEDYLKEFFEEYVSGSNAVDMIIILGENSRQDDLDVEWVAAKSRNGSPDNTGRTMKNTRGFGAKHFYATTLPVATMVDLGYSPRIYFDQSHISSGGSGSHPVDGGTDGNTLPVSLPTGKAENGSGGAFIYNQVFYNLMKCHSRASSNIAAGMISVPQPGTSWANTATIKTALIDAIKRSLGSI